MGKTMIKASPKAVWRFFLSACSASKKCPWILAILTFNLGIFCSVLLVLLDRHILFHQETVLAQENLFRVRSRLESSFSQRFALIPALNAFVQANHHLDLTKPVQEKIFRQEFIQFTEALHGMLPGVVSMQLSPNGVVTYLSNEARNRPALGHDLLVDDRLRDQVIQTIKDRGVIVAGPLQLMQGGEALIARQAIFTHPGIYTPEKYIQQKHIEASTPWLKTIPADFWGFATVIIDTQQFYTQAGLGSPDANYRYAIRGRNGLGDRGEIFFGDPQVFQRPLALGTVQLSGKQEWVLAIQTRHTLPWQRSLFIASLGLFFSSILSYSILASADIKQRKQLEKNLSTVLGEQQDLLKMLETQKEQLKEVNNELRQASVMKDRFLATMSHELRTPLNAILGTSESLQEGIFGLLDTQKADAVNVIETSAEHLLEIINDILETATITLGTIQLQCHIVDLEAIVHACGDLVRHDARKKHLALEIQDQAEAHTIWGDERRLRQIVLNLLKNAVKFTPAGGRITVTITSSSSNTLSVAIEDTGIGIHPDSFEHLFEPFSQLDSDLNRQYEGTGLGLALVKRLVELHGGKVVVRSQVGEGSCFTVTLPRGLNPSLSDAFSTENEISMQAQDRPLLPSSSAVAKEDVLILLAEDNRTNSLTISGYLKHHGYQVVVATNGEEAVAMVQSEHPHLILMDIQMPKMDGLEAIQIIRQRLGLNLPIVALTALAMPGDRDLCLAAGANDYISKPVRFKDLVLTLEKFLM